MFIQDPIVNNSTKVVSQMLNIQQQMMLLLNPQVILELHEAKILLLRTEKAFIIDSL